MIETVVVSEQLVGFGYILGMTALGLFLGWAGYELIRVVFLCRRIRS